MGDASDNVPGIKGVGPMTAIPLLKEYGDIETLLDNADKACACAPPLTALRSAHAVSAPRTCSM